MSNIHNPLTIGEAQAIVDLINNVMVDIDGLSAWYYISFTYCDGSMVFNFLDGILVDASDVDDNLEVDWKDYIIDLVIEELDSMSESLTLQATALRDYCKKG